MFYEPEMELDRVWFVLGAVGVKSFSRGANRLVISPPLAHQHTRIWYAVYFPSRLNGLAHSHNLRAARQSPGLASGTSSRNVIPRPMSNPAQLSDGIASLRRSSAAMPAFWKPMDRPSYAGLAINATHACHLEIWQNEAIFITSSSRKRRQNTSQDRTCRVSLKRQKFSAEVTKGALVSFQVLR